MLKDRFDDLIWRYSLFERDLKQEIRMPKLNLFIKAVENILEWLFILFMFAYLGVGMALINRMDSGQLALWIIGGMGMSRMMDNGK